MSSIHYREASSKDIPDLAYLRSEDKELMKNWNDRISAYLEGRHHPQQALEARIIYVAEDADQIIGFIAGHLTRRFNCDAELQWINVRKDFRNRGVATELLYLLGNWCITHQSYKICVDPGNEIARQFYRNNGAEDLNEHWMYWKDIRSTISAGLPSKPNDNQQTGQS